MNCCCQSEGSVFLSQFLLWNWYCNLMAYWNMLEFHQHFCLAENVIFQTISGKAVFNKERSCSSLSYINTTLCQLWAGMAWCCVIEHIFMLYIISWQSIFLSTCARVHTHTHNYFLFLFLETTIPCSTEILWVQLASISFYLHCCHHHTLLPEPWTFCSKAIIPFLGMVTQH